MIDLQLRAFYQPAKYDSKGDAYGDGRDDGFNGMALQALGGFIKNFFGGVAALFHDTPRCLQPIFNYIGNHTRHPRSLSRCFGDLLAGLAHH
jgi:hypothetical protein